MLLDVVDHLHRFIQIVTYPDNSYSTNGISTSTTIWGFSKTSWASRKSMWCLSIFRWRFSASHSKSIVRVYTIGVYVVKCRLFGEPKFLRWAFPAHNFTHAVLTSWPAPIDAGSDVAGDHRPKKVRFGSLNVQPHSLECVMMRSIKICSTREAGSRSLTKAA